MGNFLCSFSSSAKRHIKASVWFRLWARSRCDIPLMKREMKCLKRRGNDFGPWSYASAAWQTKQKQSNSVSWTQFFFMMFRNRRSLEQHAFTLHARLIFWDFWLTCRSVQRRRKWRIMEVFSRAEIKRMLVENWNNLIYFRFYSEILAQRKCEGNAIRSVWGNKIVFDDVKIFKATWRVKAFNGNNTKVVKFYECYAQGDQ